MRNLKNKSYCPNVYTVFTGRVQSFKFPLTLPGEWLEYKIHGDIITQMKLSLDDNRLITASKDGSLCFWQVGLFNLTIFFPCGSEQFFSLNHSYFTSAQFMKNEYLQS